jgi:hypothetical protein
VIAERDTVRDVSMAPPTAIQKKRNKENRQNDVAWRKWTLRVVPYVVAVAVVVAILRRYPLSDIVHQMEAGHALRMLPFGLALPFIVWVPYAAYDRIVFEAVIGPVPFRAMLRAKAATALLLTLGYFLGGGGYAVWIARRSRVGAGRAAGAVLYMMASDLVAVCAVAGASMWFGGSGAHTPLRAIATWVFAVQLALILLGRYGRWRLPPIFEPWRTVPRARSLVQIAGRAGNIAVITAVTWGAMRAFGIDVPARAAATYVPLIALATALPISVAGLGAGQAAWLLLLPWGTGPQLLAFHFLWSVSGGLGVAVRGIPFVGSVVRDIGGGDPRQDGPAP